MKTLSAIASILLSIVLLVGCDQRRDTQTPIDGLFGIKLGEPLPQACTNEHSFGDGKPDKWGFQMILSIAPLQTNSAFDSDNYWVTLTPTNRLVCMIRGNARNPDFESFNGLLAALRSRYGAEIYRSKNKTYTLYQWRNGSRKLSLEDFGNSFFLECEDEHLSFSDYQMPVADTNGL